MAKIKTKKAISRARVASSQQELDGTYLLKLVLYLIVGSFWLKLTLDSSSHIPIPFGLLIGLLFASHERLRIDRKIEYAVLLAAMLIGYFAPFGIYISM
jgi:hypothetical protein